MADAATWHNMTTKELEAALPRVQGELRQLDPFLQNKRVETARQAVAEASLAFVIQGTKEAQLAATEARRELEQAAEERETAADRRRMLEQAEKAIETALRHRRAADNQERQRIAAPIITARLEAVAEILREGFLDAATLIAIGGTAPSEPGQVIKKLEQVVGIEVDRLFQESRRRAAEALQNATPKNDKQEATPCH
ncbi:MAG: hypothetical protein RJA59_417 [Pseudomonadota bacterium]|jgi:hypothetical protein